jgi:protein-tyrosine phosphatase
MNERLKMKKLGLLIPIIIINFAFFLTSCSNKQKQNEQSVHSRHIDLEGQPNFRDIGGYKTTDGKTVKWGEIYRTGILSKLTDSDLKRIDSLQLKTVVNFLTDFEIENKGKDRLPDNVSQQPIPIENDPQIIQSLRDLVEARKTGDFAKVPAEMNFEIHKIITKAARKEYAELYRKILDSKNRPLAFHCSHGVHRTGTAAAILLYALGVPWETIREDYLLSNLYRHAEIEERVKQLTELSAKSQNVPVEEVDNKNIKAFYILDGIYIDGVKEVIENEYGGVNEYLSEGLGLTDDEINKLKRDLLSD